MKHRRGDAGSTELVMVLPIAFTMLLAVFQLGLWAHAQHRAEAIAERAMAAARAHDATAGTGTRAGEEAAAQLKGGILHDPMVSVARGGGQARASVTGTTYGLIPGWTPAVRALRSGPVERLTP
ncbi:TadE family protein [Nocardiopsis chromatogenes]|uniref:TadE family protein n=1 Tax=Nocardiopsis chromatogenes TaxID=280239 RepID=UPI000345606E|nr:TadE family protein [Nocardiopsis chromatogenes]